MNFNDDNEQLVFYDVNEARRQAQAQAEAEEDAQFVELMNSSYIDQSVLYGVLNNETIEPELIRALREKKEKARIQRHKTNQSTGNFLVDFLIMLTVSPRRFVAGWKTFLKFFYLGNPRTEEDELVCEKLHQQKVNLFWKDVMSPAFRNAAIFQVLLMIGGGAWFYFAKMGLRGTHFPSNFWKIFWTVVPFEIFWVSFKIFLRSVVNVMKEVYEIVTKNKEDADKKRKAAKDARQKQLEQQRRQRQQQSNTPQPEEQSQQTPARPSGRLNRRSSG